jgi:septum formation protein
MAGPSLILASGSPRRRVLLRRAGFPFIVAHPDIDETRMGDEPAADMVARLAREKARAVAIDAGGEAIVLAADTAVVLGGDTLGKPHTTADAIAMLLRLGGTDHDVVTGYCLCRGQAGEVIGRGLESTGVVFRSIDREAAAAYVATGEPFDKAGAYAIQGLGRQFVEEIRGSFTNVMGLPMEAVTPMLLAAGMVTRPGGE